ELRRARRRLGLRRRPGDGAAGAAPVALGPPPHAPRGARGPRRAAVAWAPPDVAAALAGGPVPAEMSEQERSVFESLRAYSKEGNWSYLTMMTARPQAVGYGMTDSPAG